MKIHESHPTGSTPSPEVNVAVHNNSKSERNYSCGRGRSHNMDVVEDYIKFVLSMWYERTLVHTFRIPEHLKKLYSASIKKKGKNVEIKLINQNNDVESNFEHKDDGLDYNDEARYAYNDDDFKNLVNFTHFDVKDFFKNDGGKVGDEKKI
ncbi:glycine-rich RNA-binding protein RZ1A-like [Gossypium australe]|uniref:Glycine-rich RNA-binding protein RZ1A-like n=1 Tax=Gossypium australe TaxID=47621 RepID=A0A5B6VVI5_9ROSI|nr:glycine-rich RNA-binding protein RZ1A-like [Gossypium australe]